MQNVKAFTAINNYEEKSMSLSEVVSKIKPVNLSQTEIINHLNTLAKQIPDQYLKLWLKKGNLKSIIRQSLQKEPDEVFIKGETSWIGTQPRGLVCHWIAGNVLTLTIFSLINSLLGQNKNILRVPKHAQSVVLPILRKLKKINPELTESIACIYYEKTDEENNKLFSLVADTRIIWGGEKAVSKIKYLPTKIHCEDIIFGPKYSIGIFDKKNIENESFKLQLKNAVIDVVLFEQTACSSPQTLFFEKNEKYMIKDIIKLLKIEFEKNNPKKEQSDFIATKIINTRAENLLTSNVRVEMDTETSWTIIHKEKIQLEEPIQYRTLFVKEVDDLNNIIPLITHNVQTIGIGIDIEEKEEFLIRLTKNGVSRCVKFGTANNYETPWDGMFPLQRLVRFVKVRK